MGKNSMFARGYSASRAEKRRQDKAKENAGKRLWRFFLKEDGDEAELRFLTEEPVNFYEHTVKKGDNFESYCCAGEDCSLCEDGEKVTYKGAYLVIDRREFEYTDKNGKKQTGKNQIRLFSMGMKVVSQLDRISSKYGLSNRDVTIVRLGKGTSTTYTIERGDESHLSKKEIEALLPDHLREMYDGTKSSLMDIVEDQLRMLVYGYEDDSDDDYDEEYEDDSESIITIDDEEEEEKPKKKKMFKKSSSENSSKSRAKKLLNK